MKNLLNTANGMYTYYSSLWGTDIEHKIQKSQLSVKKKKKAVSSHHHKAVMPHQISNLASAALKRHRNEPSTEEIKC